MKPKIKINGEYIPVTEFIKNFSFPDCLCPEPKFRYVHNNGAIQARCHNCNKFFGNVKYDYTEEEN